MSEFFFGLAGAALLLFLLWRRKPEPDLGGKEAKVKTEVNRPNKERILFEIRQEAERLGVNPLLALALAADESELDPSAFNQEERAVGLFQIRQAALTDYNDANKALLTLDQLFDVSNNIRVGIWYLAWLQSVLKAFLGRVPTELEILQSYKGGIGNFKRHQVSRRAMELAARAWGRVNEFA